jgi:hypothetical protein
VLLVLGPPAAAQTPADRKRLADATQASLRTAGCRKCRAWVTGSGNTTIHILDLNAAKRKNDYRKRPTSYFNAGFTRVVYYRKRGVVYARHALPAMSRLFPRKTPDATPRESVRKRSRDDSLAILSPASPPFQSAAPVRLGRHRFATTTPTEDP